MTKSKHAPIDPFKPLPRRVIDFIRFMRRAHDLQDGLSRSGGAGLTPPRETHVGGAWAIAALEAWPEVEVELVTLARYLDQGYEPNEIEALDKRAEGAELDAEAFESKWRESEAACAALVNRLSELRKERDDLELEVMSRIELYQGDVAKSDRLALALRWVLDARHLPCANIESILDVCASGTGFGKDAILQLANLTDEGREP